MVSKKSPNSDEQTGSKPGRLRRLGFDPTVATVAFASAVCLLIAWFGNVPFIGGGGAAGMCYVGAKIIAAFARRKISSRSNIAPVPSDRGPQTSAPVVPEDTEALAVQMLKQGRYALLLRPQLIQNLSPQLGQDARETLSDRMALVPDGQLLVGQTEDSDQIDRKILPRGRIVTVQRFFLDRHLVTNKLYQEFVDAGGYEQMALWDQQILPGVLDFVDETGAPGPAGWRNGRYPKGLENHPVVGVSWYEAAAYSRWVGKRLPTDVEWEKAGSWPVELAATNRPGRRFPWGNAMDRTRCNIWGSGPGGTVAVDEFQKGVSVGGIQQLVGNVWEWTSGIFGAAGFAGRDYQENAPLRTIRGGAFDTYFENHVTCQFQSAEDPVARKHNIGFRCAVSVCDLESNNPQESEPEEQIAGGEADTPSDNATSEELVEV